MSAHLEGAASWICELSLGDVPHDVLDLARTQRIDVFAAAAAGRTTRAGLAIVRAVDGWGVGRHIVPVLASPRSMMGTAYELAALAGVLEYDHWIFGGHTGQAAVSSALAVGLELGKDGREILLAQIVANEVGGRLGVLMTTGPQHGHMKSYMHRAAAAAATARLLGLSRDATVHALALALAQPEHGLFPGAFSSDEKAIAYADPTIAGIRAALLAAEGLRGVRNVVEHPVGLVAALSEAPYARDPWDRLGRSYCLSAISIKPVVACAYAAAATMAAAAIRDEIGADVAARTRNVRVFASALTVSMESFSRPHDGTRITEVNTNFSTKRSVALALLEGAPYGESFAAERFEETAHAMDPLAHRVELRHDWKKTVALLRGIDAAIDHPGRPGVYGMAESHRTMDRFREQLGTKPFVALGDLPALALLGPDATYLLRRYARGYRARLPFVGGRAARAAYASSDTDLRAMSFAAGARVEVDLDDGRSIAREIDLPRGFSGDADRANVATEKLAREARRVMNAEEAIALGQALASPFPAGRELEACVAGTRLETTDRTESVAS
jgi:2-methylcitrate dehydratase PrpD